MSTFDVKARRLVIHSHDNADALELAQIEGTDYQAVVRKGEFNSGDIAIYIPESAIVPETLLREMGLEGALAGGTVGPDGKKLKDRVKAVRLRGALSQGLVYRPDMTSHYRDVIPLEEGTDYAELLGISKYSPPIPINMAGRLEPVDGLRTYTDIENIKRFPEVLVDGEEVICAEKLHGTCTVVALIDGQLAVSSKGNAGKGLGIIRDTDEEGKTINVYWRMAERYDLESKLQMLSEPYLLDSTRIHIYGETLGVQDLLYGLPKGELEFRAFDIRVDEQFLDYDQLVDVCRVMTIPTVPVLYRGPFNREAVEAAATGRETFSGSESHVREGVVVRPVAERRDPELGRVILKVISPDYLLRKGDATELE